MFFRCQSYMPTTSVGMAPNTTPKTMKSDTEYLTFNVPARMGFVNITSQVEDMLARSDIQEGLLLCNATHI
jgi:hypothetical protein